MGEAKTTPTSASVAAHLAAIEDDERRRDCQALAAMMTRVTGAAPTMWGPSIVGFGRYHYRYESGHEGDSCLVGFAARRKDISVYVVPGLQGGAALLAKLGKHKMGKACLSITRLSGIDMDVLEELVARSVAETRRRYPE